LDAVWQDYFPRLGHQGRQAGISRAKHGRRRSNKFIIGWLIFAQVYVTQNKIGGSRSPSKEPTIIRQRGCC
jgi:hypothetical protein